MLWTDGSMYEGEWDCGIQHGLGRMIFTDGTTKEGYFENNVFKYEIKGDGMVPSASNLQSASSIPKGSPLGAHQLQMQMRSTKASSGFQTQDQQNPYQLNQLAA